MVSPLFNYLNSCNVFLKQPVFYNYTFSLSTCSFLCHLITPYLVLFHRSVNHNYCFSYNVLQGAWLKDKRNLSASSFSTFFERQSNYKTLNAKSMALLPKTCNKYFSLPTDSKFLKKHTQLFLCLAGSSPSVPVLFLILYHCHST